MDAKQAILKIKALFEDMPIEAPKDEAAPKEAVAKMESIEYTLEDGSKVMIDKLEIGGMVSNSDGTPAKAGEIKLADGTSIQIDEAGSIIEIASPAEDMIPEEAPSEEMKKMKDLQAEFQAKFDILTLEKEILTAKLKSIEQKSKEGFNQVISLIEEIAKIPSVDPIEKPQSFNYQETKDIKFERLAKYRQAILNNKN